MVAERCDGDDIATMKSTDVEKEMGSDAGNISMVAERCDGDDIATMKSTEDRDAEGGDAEIGPTASQSCGDLSKKIYGTHTFLIHVIIGILIAKAYPPLGGIYLAPQITATWVAVIFIFGEHSFTSFRLLG